MLPLPQTSYPAVESNPSAKSVNRQYREELAFRQITLRKLAGGLFPSPGERQLALAQANLSFPGHIFRVLAFCFDDPIKIHRTHPPRDVALLWYGVANIAQELFDEMCVCEKVTEEDGAPVLLLNSDDGLERGQMIPQLSQTLVCVEDSLSISCSAGVSGPVRSLDALPLCREQALTAAMYSALFEPHSVIFYSDIAGREANPPQYPLREEQALLGAMVRRCRADVLAASAAFRSKLFSCRMNDVCPYLFRLATVLNAQIVKDGRKDSQLGLLCVGSPQNAFHADAYMEQLTASALEHFDFLERRRLQQTDGLLSSVASLIRSRFQDPDLSIEEVLKQSACSPGHIRRLFQEVYHCTPHDYLLALRMEEAQRLLRETDESIKAITAAVGFNNPSYFYTAFKRQVGVSAQDYRAQYRSGSIAG